MRKMYKTSIMLARALPLSKLFLPPGQKGCSSTGRPPLPIQSIKTARLLPLNHCLQVRRLIWGVGVEGGPREEPREEVNYERASDAQDGSLPRALCLLQHSVSIQPTSADCTFCSPGLISRRRIGSIVTIERVLLPSMFSPVWVQTLNSLM